MGEVSEVKRKPSPVATKVVSGMMALFALGASLMAGVGPFECLLRGGVAYVLGGALSGLWCALFPTEDVEMHGEPIGEEPVVPETQEVDEAAAA